MSAKTPKLIRNKSRCGHGYEYWVEGYDTESPNKPCFIKVWDSHEISPAIIAKALAWELDTHDDEIPKPHLDFNKL